MTAQGIADSTAAATVGIAASTWITDLNAILQLGATTVAIFAGIAAIWWHVERIRAARRERLNEEGSNTKG